MKSVNKVILIGNLGKDPEVKYTPQGTPVAKITIATNERFKDKDGQWADRTEWHNVVLWQRMAEIAGEYLKKGGKVYIEGRLQTRSCEGGGEYASRSAPASVGNHFDQREPEHAPAAAPAGPITDEDIPF